MRSIKKNKRSRLNRKTRLYKFKSIKKRNSKLKRKRVFLKTRRKQKAGSEGAKEHSGSLEEEDRTNKVFKSEIWVCLLLNNRHILRKTQDGFLYNSHSGVSLQ